jgi:hypothetical protein
MTDQITPDVANVQPEKAVKFLKSKRAIFRFNGDKPTAINLEHVTNMCIEGKRVTFNFYSTALYVDLETDEAASTAFEQLLNVWAADVLE